jgi:mannose-6-phosphate isomerase class I
LNKQWRKTDQLLLPGIKPATREGRYDIYPSYRLEEKQILKGYNTLAELFLQHNHITVEGYAGVDFQFFREELERLLKSSGARVNWIDSAKYLKPAPVIDKMISPFTGDDDPLFGTRTTLGIEDFFEADIRNLKPEPDADLNIIYGTGSSLAGWQGLLVYADIPKNEIQFRSRAGSTTNLGALQPEDPERMYKRFYFVDWVVLNGLKKKLLPDIDIIVDCQDPYTPAWMSGTLLRKSLSEMSHNIFRVRPWFEPGAWGGSWIKEHIEGLSGNVPNYAWSFELITPENGLLFESSGNLLETSFDLLMYQEAASVLGDSHDRFGTDFPIRFDFLDTFNGGNLSIQCHPCPEYMKKNFGENFTQEETYYILDTKDNAVVYLGFQDDIDPMEFENSLLQSLNNHTQLVIEKYIQKHNASRHDLFLIPYGTIHGSGKNNLVLEISTTPYIFTFKMYDWLRLDLNGKPRPLNIGRGMDNLVFDRKGKYVRQNLISHPVLIDEGRGWKLFHLPTHETHLYDVHRFHIEKFADVKTLDKCHVLSLVEGTGIVVETKNGFRQKFSFAETFVIPASAGEYRIINDSGGEAIVIKAFVK